MTSLLHQLVKGGFFTLPLKTVPAGVGYPIWVGIGTVGAVIFGAVFFQENLSRAKVASVVVILLRVVRLTLTSIA